MLGKQNWQIDSDSKKCRGGSYTATLKLTGCNPEGESIFYFMVRRSQEYNRRVHLRRWAVHQDGEEV